MESKESIDGGENDNEFIVISQTLVDLCEKVCSKIAFGATSIHDGGISCENPNVPKVMYGVVKPMVTLTSGENGCSGEPLGTAVNSAVSCVIECDGTSDTGTLKPIVVLSHSENGSIEPLGIAVNGAVSCGIECDGTSDTGVLKPIVVLSHSENGSIEPLGIAVNDAVSCDIECDGTSDTGVLKPIVVLSHSENGSIEPLGIVVNGAVSCDIECDGTSDTGTLKPIVVLSHSENDSIEPLGTAVSSAVSCDIECDDTSDTGVLKPIVVLSHSENGSIEPLGTVVNGAVSCDIECDGTSDTGILKPIVVLKHSENGATEPLGTSVDGAIEHGIECDDTSDTLKPLVALTPSGNDCCGVPSNTDTMKDGADRSNMECDTTASTDTVMSDNESKTLFVGENAKDDHHEDNQSLGVLDGEANKEPCCNGSTSRTTQEDQHESLDQAKYNEEVIEKTGTDNGDMSGVSSSKDDLAESEKELRASGECDTCLPVVSDTVVSELNGLELRPEQENSTQSCGTNTHSVESPMATENACDKVTQMQKADGMNDQNVVNPHTLKQRRKKKVVSKKNKSIRHQTPPSMSASNASGDNVVVNDFEFVLSVVQQDLEEIQMTNVTHAAISSEDDTNEDSSDDEGESSDTSSSSSTGDSPSNLSNSKRFAENIIEDEDRVHVMSGPPRTRDEVLFSELPPPPDVELMADKDQIKQIGEIESIINAEAMVIIKSFPDVPALDTDSILFLGNGCSFGQVFEIFGQVRSPHYCVRFNSKEEIREKNLFVGQNVFYAPNAESMTNFVFVSKIQSVKGSDASWKHDQEPPDELLEYSDDEAESAAKASKKKANRLKHRNQTLMQERDTEKTAKKQRTSNATADSTPPTSKQPWINQVARQTHQPRQSCQPPVPFNIRPRNPPAQFYSERFPLGQNVPMQFNPRSHLSRLGPQPMPKLPSGVFYNHQQPHQYHTQAPVPPPYQQQPLPPPQFTSFQPCTPLAQHGTYPMIPNQSNPVNGQPQHVPRESSLPSQNVGQPLDQVWSPRVNSHLNGQPVNLGQFMARPGWPTVHPPTQPPFYCPPR